MALSSETEAFLREVTRDFPVRDGFIPQDPQRLANIVAEEKINPSQPVELIEYGSSLPGFGLEYRRAARTGLK